MGEIQGVEIFLPNLTLSRNNIIMMLGSHSATRGLEVDVPGVVSQQHRFFVKKSLETRTKKGTFSNPLFFISGIQEKGEK